MKKINRLKQEVELCRKYKDVIGKRNASLLYQFKQGALSKNDFSLKVSKNNYWVNYYDNHIRHSNELINEAEDNNKTLIHNSSHLIVILLLLTAIPLLSNPQITGYAVTEIQGPFQFAYFLTILIAIIAIFVYFKQDKHSKEFYKTINQIKRDLKK